MIVDARLRPPAYGFLENVMYANRARTVANMGSRGFTAPPSVVNADLQALVREMDQAGVPQRDTPEFENPQVLQPAQIGQPGVGGLQVVQQQVPEAAQALQSSQTGVRNRVGAKMRNGQRFQLGQRFERR